jgi:hypothetical protein
VAAAVLLAAVAGLSADTLVLREGGRVQGRLLGVRNGVVEFEEIRGNRAQVVRVDQDDVRAIEFDAAGTAGIVPVRPRGLREREVLVPSHIAWTDTGIDVRSGQMLYFTAEGRVRWGPRRQDGPEGERDSPRNPTRPIPTRPAAALIGRVGDDAPFFIGADEEGIRVRGGGRLQLGVNDDVLTDNTGEFRVSVYF